MTDFLSESELAERLVVCPKTVYRITKKSLIPGVHYVRIGNRKRYDWEAIRHFLASESSGNLAAHNRFCQGRLKQLEKVK
ncbi:helix-turn-helix domain-containing protein [Thermosynechococcaceae cyanobacterium BACA0444]|uniref:Helix-turn-helix domain-containing protein n=1 Tax=Pseudocalidococcus azoricus BACA0444 TaxID=2918990 RepID=A0AAE4JZM4_9CYAN|nr:helix-turn-helix domain-containing protein [Pseudocalidococcus azoricus]MDS3860997.1 helix-turn-helix domain-containing protein [Pseudocalidococcus azoricus BACA0444]